MCQDMRFNGKDVQLFSVLKTTEGKFQYKVEDTSNQTSRNP